MPALSRPVLQQLRARLLGRATKLSTEALVAALDRALHLRRGVKEAREARRERHQESVAETRDVRVLVAARAGGHCECCGLSLARFVGAWDGSMDHFFGGSARKSLESVETCWMLCWACERAKTRNHPNAEHWCLEFREHAVKYGYSTAIKLVDKSLDKIHVEKQLHAMRLAQGVQP